MGYLATRFVMKNEMLDGHIPLFAHQANHQSHSFDIPMLPKMAQLGKLHRQHGERQILLDTRGLTNHAPATAMQIVTQVNDALRPGGLAEPYRNSKQEKLTGHWRSTFASKAKSEAAKQYPYQ